MLLAYTLHILLLTSTSADSLLVTIADQRRNQANDAMIYERFHYKDILVGGSHIEGVAVHKTSSEEHWSVSAPLVYALPNQGSPSGLMNEADIPGNILLISLQGATLPVHGLMQIAQDASAAAVVFIASENTRPKKVALEAALVASQDYHDLWPATIPTVIVADDQFPRLVSGLNLIHGDLAQHLRGQYVVAGSEYADWILHNQDYEDEDYEL